MCNKSSSKPPDVVRTRSMIKNKVTATSTKSLKPAARKTRTKTRKPKYLSLRLELSQHQTPNCADDMSGHHQLNLFPLHPEKMVDDKLISDINDDNNVAYLFHAEGEDTLNGLLTTTTTATTTPATTMSSEEDSMSHAYSFRAQDQCSKEINDDYKAKCLERTAMRNRERDMSEEKWVSYSEVVEEVTSSGSGAGSACVADDLWFQRRSTKGSLALKLDYQGILNAWSDKGPLYIHAHGDLDTSPQIVPDLHDDKSSNVLTDGLDSSAGNVWKVPENNGGNATSNLKIKEEEGGKDDWKMGQREASLLRYKEKRHSRLFSKRIRYQVRKLNAEKRPRMKGRFVKRS